MHTHSHVQTRANSALHRTCLLAFAYLLDFYSGFELETVYSLNALFFPSGILEVPPHLTGNFKH